jgi:hypothetical protein
MQITDTATGLTYGSNDRPTELGKEINFTSRAMQFLVSMSGNVYLYFEGGQTVNLSARYPGRFILER